MKTIAFSLTAGLFAISFAAHALSTNIGYKAWTDLEGCLGGYLSKDDSEEATRDSHIRQNSQFLGADGIKGFNCPIPTKKVYQMISPSVKPGHVEITLVVREQGLTTTPETHKYLVKKDDLKQGVEFPIEYSCGSSISDLGKKVLGQSNKITLKGDIWDFNPSTANPKYASAGFLYEPKMRSSASLISPRKKSATPVEELKEPTEAETVSMVLKEIQQSMIRLEENISDPDFKKDYQGTIERCQKALDSWKPYAPENSLLVKPAQDAVNRASSILVKPIKGYPTAADYQKNIFETSGTK